MKHARTFPALALAVLLTSPILAQSPGQVLAEERLVFAGPLAPGDEFGRAVCALGDVDGDGIGDLAVGAPGDDTDALRAGAVWILLLDAAGDVRQATKIGAAEGLGQVPPANVRFGESLGALGDLDGDGTPDLAVGAPGGIGPILLWECSLLFLNPDGSLKGRTGVDRAALGISSTQYGFGQGLAALELDGDGRPELVVTDPNVAYSSPRDDVHVVALDPSGAVESSTVLHTSAPLFAPGIGRSAANVGDRNGDGIPDLAVGDPYISFSGVGQLVGQLWLFFMSPDGSAPSSLRIGPGLGGFGGLVGADDKFGLQVTEIADLDGNGVTDLAVAANDAWAYPAGFAAGVVWLLFMEPGGTVGSELLLAPGRNGFVGPLGTRDHFGEGLAWTDHGTGAGTLWVGSHGDDTTANEAGAVWRLTLDGATDPPGVRVRNGTHVNPVVLASTGLPRVDSTWTAEVDAFAFPATTTTYLVGYEDPARLPLAFGELLVLIEPAGTNVFVDAAAVVAGVGQHALSIPDDLAFVGREVHVQGLLAGGGPRLTNALELTIGGP